MTTTGCCLCGAIQFEFAGEALETTHCHCESCRRQTSSPVATFVTVHKSALRVTRGQPNEYASSPDVRRSFRGTCGLPIAYRRHRRGPRPEEGTHLHVTCHDRRARRQGGATDRDRGCVQPAGAAVATFAPVGILSRSSAGLSYPAPLHLDRMRRVANRPQPLLRFSAPPALLAQARAASLELTPPNEPRRRHCRC